MKLNFKFILAAAAMLLAVAALSAKTPAAQTSASQTSASQTSAAQAPAGKYSYETVEGDPIGVRIYTLDNGLKIYTSVNKETPRIQAQIAVKAGAKYDPAGTSGLAHYFEHLMFKGSENYGTIDYAAEKPMLDEIERLFEQYRQLTDEQERRAVYKTIDSISYEASKLFIPNEYDKLMQAIGAQGTNAYTGYDQTVFIEDIPANQLENWAKIQVDRFKHIVIRGFHTELETVYEEKNMTLTNDNRKMLEAMLAALFPSHPYGAQTIIGTQHNLKNPSITNIKNFFNEWYVPNNIAICLVGDFDPDNAVAIIDRYFGDMTPNNELKHLEITAEKPIVSPVEVTVVGSEAANVNLAWRIGGAASEDMDVLNIINAVLTNGKAGLIDLNLVQQQKVLMAGADIMLFADHGLMLLRGFPKADQTLEQVRDLLLEQLDMLKAGNFDESLLEATINNYKAGIMRLNESNSGRMGMMVDSYINGVDWEREVKLLDRMSRITKEQVVAMANKYFNRNNYVVIYKREGKDENTVKVEKPEITPIITNRDASSEFLKKVRESKVEPIEPVFLDYDRDLAKLKAKSGIEVLYVQNHTNDLYTLEYVFETGTNNDPALAMALDYLQYLGTDKYTAEQIQQEFYRIANSFRLSAGEQRTTISINGINENIEQAITLLEDLLANAKPDEEVLANYKADLAKSRSDQKLNQMTNFRRMRSYAQYGPKSPATNVLSNEELEAITSEELLARIRKFADMQHRIIYYGPMSGKQIVKTIDRFHHVPAKLTPAPAQVVFKPLETKENKILLSHYDAKQIYYSQYSGRGEMFQPSIDPQVRLYNDYFGGSMNAIVFQEMREARGLAYTAQAGLLTPARKEIPYAMTALIMTQNDKMVDAAAAFMEIIDNMPESQQRLDIAKESIMTNIRTQRIIKENIIRNYMAALDLGINYDRRRSIFETIPSLTIDDVKDFQLKWVKGRKYTYTILGNESELDMKSMEEKYGPVQRVSQEELFGY